MAKVFVKIGYGVSTDKGYGVSEFEYSERDYYGELTRGIIKHDNSGQVIDNINVNNSLSILADPFAYNHVGEMQYVEMLGSKWKITSVELRYPRLILAIGGVYNDGN